MYRQPGLLFAEQGPLHISTVVFRISKAALAADPQWIARDGLLQLSDDLAKLPFLQTIVMETAADLQAVDLEPLRSALRISFSDMQDCVRACSACMLRATVSLSLPTRPW